MTIIGNGFDLECGLPSSFDSFVSAKMMAHDRPSQNDYDVYESILSFNYTRPVETFGSSEHDADFINIHGRLGGEIVFSIDGTGRMGNSEILPFTKTYRLMAMDLPGMGSVIHIPSGSNLDRGTQVIKFYDHSLGKADYSYFQAIFDAVNLYEGSTSLAFFFTNRVRQARRL